MDVQETRREVKGKEEKFLSNPSNRTTEAKLRVFIKQYAQHGRVLRACEIAGIAHNVHYRRLQTDAGYRAAVEEAEQAAAQQLEDRVYEMAVEGELQAALALLRRFRPNLYRDRSSIEVSGSLDLVDRLTQARNRVITIDESDRTGTAG